ncbi:helix-turn-helix domain-containing protein [Kutzneria buriramensis]|uniref:Helix-turn-helix protein n=1 Tax=Kutzneria buriramensis TaxID=1045776 RepID=A0A3E0HHS0_9PSEU|nr:helix-turn-helix transcriptional regulator [Kutzneria buriramensis]REH44906.1 helix-turn-helix protein [Kutzneria buriramensis]
MAEHERTFAEVLEELCRSPRPDGRPHTNVEIAAAVGVGHSYIGQLRSGKKVNPSLTLVLALAEHFGVHPRHFVGGDRERTPGSLPVTPFAERLTQLCELVHPLGKPPLGPTEIIGRIREHGERIDCGPWTMSPHTLADYRSGANADPSLIHLLALAKAFGTRPAYFLDEEYAGNVVKELKELALVASLGLHTVVLRASEQDISRETLMTALANAFDYTDRETRGDDGAGPDRDGGR